MRVGRWLRAGHTGSTGPFELSHNVCAKACLEIWFCLAEGREVPKTPWTLVSPEEGCHQLPDQWSVQVEARTKLAKSSDG